MSAFIKQYKARNGATVIQAVFKNGRSVVKTIHVGTAHNDIGIAELREVAKDIIYQGQMSMDLDESPAGTYMALESAYSAVLWDALSKSDLKARPVFHYTRDAIEAHLTIVFAALAVSRRIQALTGVSIKRFLKILRPSRTGKLRIAGKVRTVEPVVPPVARGLIEKI